MALKEIVGKKMTELREDIKGIVKEHGKKVISEVTIASAYGGMRGVNGLVTETSLLDPEEGIRFRGYDIPEVREKLPKAQGGDEPLPEGIFWLLLTGQIPTAENVKEVTGEWQKRSSVPDEVWKTLDALPKSMHPMTQFSIAILALQPASQFARRYNEGMDKMVMWEPMYEDAMNLLAQLPAVAAYIYRRTYKDGRRIEADPKLDWAANFAHMKGIENPEYHELMRLYMVLHCDHEGGNVSAHATHLVGSALSDAYLSLSAGMNGLAGPLHGLANQEVLRWIQKLMDKLGGKLPTKEELKKALWDTLQQGQVIPGYGHAVLRKTDPRYIAQREFAQKHGLVMDDDLFKLVSMLFEVAPQVLMEHGKAKNPWPNVDAYSGVLKWHYGVKEYDYYTVMFGVSRAMGVLASLIWDRGLLLPIERPKSVTTEWVKSQIDRFYYFD
jgi:citrate synthase